MSQFRTTADILDEILQKAGEVTNGNSPYESMARTFANKVHHAIIGGGNIFNLEVDEPWQWARARYPITLELKPAFDSGTATATLNSVNISFSTAPTESLEGWFLQANGKSTVYRITNHSADGAAAMLDSSWLDTSGGYTFRAFKLEYEILPTHLIVDSNSDRIEFQETSSATLTASLTHGAYTPTGLLSHAVTQIDTIGANTYNSSYDTVLKRSYITRTGTAAGTYFNLLGASGTMARRSALPLLGYDQLDYTGATTYTSAYTPNAICRLIEPFVVFSGSSAVSQIESMDVAKFERDYPLAFTLEHTPDRFTKIAESNDGSYIVRFNYYPQDACKVNIGWIPAPIDLQDNAVSVPRIPRKDIDVLINAAAMYLLWDKTDSKFADVKQMTEIQLKAMEKKNRSEMSRTGPKFGQIIPRKDADYPIRNVSEYSIGASSGGGSANYYSGQVSHTFTDGQSATSLSGETVDGTVYTCAFYEFYVARGTTVYASGQFALHYRNGTWAVVLGAYEGDAHGLTFSVSQSSTTAQLKLAADTGAGNGTLKVKKHWFSA